MDKGEEREQGGREGGWKDEGAGREGGKEGGTHFALQILAATIFFFLSYLSLDLHTSPWIFITLPGSCADKIVAARIFFEKKGKEREQARKGRK